LFTKETRKLHLCARSSQPVMKKLFKTHFIYLTVVVIGILLAINIGLTYYNNTIIERNRAIQHEVEVAKLYYDQIGKSVIHSLDIGLRGFAIVRNAQFVAPLDNALIWKDSIITNAETPLKKLHYDFRTFNVLIDSLDAYATYCYRLKKLLLQGRDEEFTRIFAADKGGHLWWQYLECEKDIQHYVNGVGNKAREEYEAALYRNLILQVLLFAICFPTLIYTAIHTGKTFQLSELLRRAEKDKNKILHEQNVMLERRVGERTQEIQTQNEEISSQSEQLSAQRDALLAQNRELQDARETIEKQHAEIHAMNQHLKQEVDSRTMEVHIANKELIEQNTQLEQFAFIAAHNLRAPLARILGLTTLIKISTTEEDKQTAFEKLEESTRDLDHVIKDLTVILNIKKHTSNLAEVDLEDSFVRVKRMLEKEIEETQTRIHHDFTGVKKVYAVMPYVESILYNLISNAIKYRNPEHLPVVSVSTRIENEFVCLMVNDNGLGIDLPRYKSSMFNLYKRFHLHMEGKGLGLYLVKTQIEALGGKIEVQSKPNEGTTFFVYFKRSLV
jgi:signal transduction histidine kinase